MICEERKNLYRNVPLVIAGNAKFGTCCSTVQHLIPVMAYNILKGKTEIRYDRLMKPLKKDGTPAGKFVPLSEVELKLCMNEADRLVDAILCIEGSMQREAGKESKPEISALPEYITCHKNNDGEISGYELDLVLYSDFLHDEFGTVFFNKNLYLYDSVNHVYRTATNEVETHIRNTLVKYDLTDKSLIDTVKELLMHLKSMGSCKNFPFNFSPDKLPVRNGVLKFHMDKVKIGDCGVVNLNECVELLPHGKEHLFTYVLDADYNPTLGSAGAFELLRQWVSNGKDVVKLLQAPAQGIVQMQTRHALKKAYLLQGESNSGKTSYFKLLIKLFTPEYVSSASLQDLCMDKFVGSVLEGKIINIRDDLQALPLSSCESFKEITGDCSIGVERKYESQYRGWATAVLMFSCNYPPRCSEQVKKDAAYWARFEYIKFPNSFGTRTRFYEETYTNDFMSIFLNALIETVMKIHHTGELLEVSDPGEVLINWSADADPIQNFMQDTFSDSQETRDFSKRKLFDEYKRWYKENELDEKRMITTENAFTSAMQPYFTVAELRLPKNAEGKREHIRVYRGNKITLVQTLDLIPVPEQTHILV